MLQRWVAGGGLAILVGIAGTASWLDLTRVVQAMPLTSLARRLELNRSVNESAVERLAPTAWTFLDTSCSEPLGRAALTVALTDAAHRNPATDFSAWSAALEGSQHLLERYIACSPLDGNAWARLALVRRLIVMAPDRIVEPMRLSAKFAPVEMNAMIGRLSLIPGANPILTAQLAPIFDRDIEIMLERGTPDAVIESLGPLRQRPEARIDARTKTLSAERLAQLRWFGFFDDPRDQDADPSALPDPFHSRADGKRAPEPFADDPH